MKTTEFNKERKLQVNIEGELFTFNSYSDLLGNFEDVKNTETWAIAHNQSVFVCNRFDTVGKIVESFNNVLDAENYANQLNEYFAIIEEYNVEEL